MSLSDPFHDLLAMTRLLAEPERQLVIIGEGNTSCRVNDDSFWIKASGQGMQNIGEGGFVQVRFAPILDFLAEANDDPAALTAAVAASKLNADAPRPSIEVLFHAAVLADCAAASASASSTAGASDVVFIAHTHPVAVNGILCSSRAEQFAVNRLFPDDVVLCGPRSVFVPYTDPGLPLARAIRANTRAYIDEVGEPPKVIVMANHGLITLGRTAQEAVNITLMAVKAAQIFSGACAIGEPVFMTAGDIAHIWKRPDEIYRRKLFAG